MYSVRFSSVQEAKCRSINFCGFSISPVSHLFIYFEAIALILLCLPSPGERKKRKISAGL